jgi:hypothetical protein
MRVYLDHNSTSPMREEVRERWLEVLDATGGNPSSPHLSAAVPARGSTTPRARRGRAGRARRRDLLHIGRDGVQQLALFGVLETAGDAPGS